MDKKGVVRTVSGNTCTVYLYDEKRDVSVSINNVDPGEPVKQDKVCCHTSYNLYIYNLYRSAYCCPKNRKKNAPNAKRWSNAAEHKRNRPRLHYL